MSIVIKTESRMKKVCDKSFVLMCRYFKDIILILQVLQSFTKYPGMVFNKRILLYN